MSYDAYEAHEHARGNYSVTLVDTSGRKPRFAASPVVCGRQAHYQATRGGQRQMTFLGVTKMVGGERVPTSFPERCGVSDPAHAHTHRLALPRASVSAPEETDH